MNRNNKGKSYNEVMNEWAAQKHFLKRSANGLMRPGSEVSGGARVRGWVWRFVIFTSIPLLVYMGWLRVHGKSPEFTTQLQNETKKYLGAEKVYFSRARWDLNGELRVEKMEATGRPQSIFSNIEAFNLSTVIPAPRVFRSAWDLERVDSTRIKMALRAGSTAPAQASVSQSLETLTAGWGLSPDFSKLTIHSYACDDLSLSWGASPSTTGDFKGSKASMTPSGGGWLLALAGGTFHQGWLEGLRITRAEARLASDHVDITRGDFSVPGGGSGSLTGSFTLGQQPEVNAVVKMENIALHQFTSDYFARFAKATGQGTVKITGSTNRTNGLLFDTTLKIQSGKLTGIPVLRALEIATNESGISAPDITGGEARITSQGSSEPGGIIIEADNILLDFGTRLKLSISVRYERKMEVATDLKEETKEKITTSTSGTFRIGLPPATAGRLKATIRQQFISREEQGLQWLDIPFNLETGDFTKDAAEKITALHFAPN